MVEEYVGMIKLFAGNFAPMGWTECRGQLMPINNNEPLFSILGTTYGGDGKTTFALPNLAKKTPASGMKYIICMNGAYPPQA